MQLYTLFQQQNSIEQFCTVAHIDIAFPTAESKRLTELHLLSKHRTEVLHVCNNEGDVHKRVQIPERNRLMLKIGRRRDRVHHPNSNLTKLQSRCWGESSAPPPAWERPFTQPEIKRCDWIRAGEAATAGGEGVNPQVRSTLSRSHLSFYRTTIQEVQPPCV